MPSKLTAGYPIPSIQSHWESPVSEIITINRGEGVEPIELKVGDHVPEFYADGVARLSMGYPNSKLTFTAQDINDAAPNIERRNSVCNINLPTGVLFQICKMVLNNALVVQTDLEKASIESSQQFIETINSLKK